MAPKVKKKYKCFTFFIKDNDTTRNKIFDVLSNNSRIIFNRSMFCYNILKYYETEIFDYVYDKVLNNKKLLKELNSRTKSSAHKLINTYIDEIYDIKYKFYSDNYDLFKKNNKFIYAFIKTELKDTVVDNFNFFSLKDSFIKKIIKKKLVSFDSINKSFVLEEVVTKILKSYYNFAFFKSKYEMLNHIPYTIKNLSKEFIKCIKEDTYLFDKKINSLKKLRELKLSIDENNLLVHLVRMHLDEDKGILLSDVVGEIVDKVYGGISSYYTKRRNGKKANIPRFLSPGDKYIVPFNAKVMSITNDNKIRLSVGQSIGNNIEQILGNQIKSHDKTTYYYKDATIDKKRTTNHVKLANNKFIHKDNLFESKFIYFGLDKKIKNEDITYIEVVPEHSRYKVCISYIDNEEKKEIYNHENKTEDELTKVSISVDLGIDNLMAVYDPEGNQILIKGNIVNGINYKYRNKISEYQKLIDTLNDDTIQQNSLKFEMEKLWIKRDQEIEGYFNRLVNSFCKHYGNKKLVIIGYNEGWKDKVNLGRKTNGKFYYIPYCKLLKKLERKLNSLGIKMIKIEESYTSKCDALSLEKLCYHSKYNGERLKRGLYKTQRGKLINADINGAINIMRKEIKLTKIRGLNIFNPICLCA